MNVVELVEAKMVGRRLGRHVEHDPRSRAYAHAHSGAPLVSKEWVRHGPILDQGDLGKCTCEAATGCAMTGPIWVPGRSVGDPEATQLYEVATRLDHIKGCYPPTDTGSTGLAAAKAATKAGWFGGYTHAFSSAAALDALSHLGPIMVGIKWYDGFDHPLGTNAEVRISGAVRGGHEIMARTVDVERRLVIFDNSWGTGYGLAGRFCMSFDTFEKILADQGDVTIPKGVSTS